MDTIAAPDSAEQNLSTIIEKFIASPRLAHAVVFANRHSHATPRFHEQIIDDLWSDEETVGEEAFREGAKSTLAEEAICLMALLKRFKFAIIIGANYDRACDRLTAIKHEIENNEIINALWGDQKGSVWNEGEILLKDGRKIQALGARMKFRGVKHNEDRPDFVFIDDLEDEENTNTPEKREKLAKWISRVVWPACRRAKKRIAGTPIHPQCWLESMRKNSGWTFRVHPIVVPAVTEVEAWEHSQWPDRYPLEVIQNIRDEYERNGDLQGFVQEYLCRSEDAALKPFQQRHIVHAAPIPAFVPSVVICDPARKGASATKTARTGYVVFSRYGRKFSVRQAFGAYHAPSEIVDTLFKLDDAFQPTWVAAEKDGLEEFLMQPLRQAMVARGTVLPLWPLRAPRDRSKDQFIRGLQPFFEAGEIELCDTFPDLEQEILNFPTGLKDVINALAYVPRVGAGKPVYEDFGLAHIAPDGLRPHKQQPLHLVVNCAPNFTAGVLMQYVNRCFRVYGDWVREGGVDEAFEQILTDAVLAADGHTMLKVFAPAEQFDQFNNLGLLRACRRRKIDPVRGPQSAVSIGALTEPLRSQALHQPQFLANKSARWTINGLAAGYARGLDKAGILSDYPDPGYYATLMQGVESFARWLSGQIPSAAGNTAHYAYTPEGRQFMSARASGVTDGRVELKRP